MHVLWQDDDVDELQRPRWRNTWQVRTLNRYPMDSIRGVGIYVGHKMSGDGMLDVMQQPIRRFSPWPWLYIGILSSHFYQMRECIESWTRSDSITNFHSSMTMLGLCGDQTGYFKSSRYWPLHLKLLHLPRPILFIQKFPYTIIIIVVFAYPSIIQQV